MIHVKDPTIEHIDYNKELFDFLKIIFPDAKAVPKKEYHYRNKSKKKKKLKASAIICPIPECNYQCIEHQKPLADLFLIHLKKVHDIKPTTEFVKNLRAKIRYLRNNNRIPYTDPFIHVQWEAFFKSHYS
jgi:hypothetical protein